MKIEIVVVNVKRYLKVHEYNFVPSIKWWLTQASIDIVNDAELLDLMKKSGCIGVFIRD